VNFINNYDRWILKMATKKWTAKQAANIIFADEDSEMSDLSDVDESLNDSSSDEETHEEQIVTEIAGDNSWHTYPDEDPYVNEWLRPYTRPRGVLVNTTNYKPVDYFKVYFTDALFQVLSDQTNLYALQHFDSPIDSPPNSRFRKWVDTDVSEIKAMIALQVAMGLCQKNEIEDYWSTYPLTFTPFRTVMSRNRYELLMSFLHFTDNHATDLLGMKMATTPSGKYALYWILWNSQWLLLLVPRKIYQLMKALFGSRAAFLSNSISRLSQLVGE
jgi:hypothetical protein